ncbi:hypothetical protein LSTR_LSTR008040 [Laodelphax striatellus]|uniref:SANT and BTB domain-containing protein n=1 Tax=Laodelphax striatellus TaxID=195883 RepID=A0A482XM75_LAOST|nr:hypothetical protein LSTR_LSTR008040 [Laodelphax striatellus]
MTDKNENGGNSRTPSLWTMQTEAARKRILNSFMKNDRHKDKKIDSIKHSSSTDIQNQQQLNQYDETHTSLLLQVPYPEQKKSSSSINIISLDDFLRVLSIAYLGTNSLDYNIDWQEERYCELFSNLIDVDIDYILPVLTEISSNTREICARDYCNAGDRFENIFLQTPSPEIMESSAEDCDNKQFSIRVELALKSSKTSLDETKQSEGGPQYETVETNRSDGLNMNLKRGRTILENRVKYKLLSKQSRIEKMQQIDRLNAMVSENLLEKVQRENTLTSHLSDSELNTKRGKDISKNIQKPKQIQNKFKKSFGNEIKWKKRNLTVEKEKRKPSPFTSSHDDDIIINVYNKRGVLKKYEFPQYLLISKMGYFAQVASTQNLKDFRVNVHCDHDIFKWILSWIKYESSKLKSAKPELNCLNVTPLLVSAFLFQITSLIDYCLNFYVYNLNDIIKYTADLGCLDDEIISRLAGLFSNVELSRVEDVTDKIVSRLYCEMITSLAQSAPEPSRGHFVTFPLVFKCALCNKIVSKEHSNNIHCLPEQQGIDYKGNIIVHHKIDTGWNITKYVRNLMKKFGSWQKVYWNMWAECHFLKCGRCCVYYSLKYSKQCATHTKNPIFKPLRNKVDSPEGIYPCCGAKLYKFDVRILQKHNGCKNISHSPLLEVDRSYSDIQKIYKSMKSMISTEHRVKSHSHDNTSKLNKPRAKPANFFHLQPQSESTCVGLLDKNLLVVDSYKRFPLKGWQDCQEPSTSCVRVSSEESVSNSMAQVKQKLRSLFSQSSRKHTGKDIEGLLRNYLDSTRDLDEGDSSTEWFVANEQKLQKCKQETDFESILETGRISVRTVEKIERKMKKGLSEIKSSLRINQDSLRDYEDRLTSEISNLLCQRTNSRSSCLLDRFPQVNLNAVVKNNQISNTGEERSTQVHSSDSEISIGSSVKTYCSTLSSSTRIYHSRTSSVWNSFTPLAGSFVRVEAEWQDTFNASMPSRTKSGRKQDDSVYINCLNIKAPVLESKRDICRRKTKSANGKSGSIVRKTWKALAPKSKISEIESYLSNTVFPTRQLSLVGATNPNVSRIDQQTSPPCEGKQNMAFTCGFTSLVNNDSLSARNIMKESDYVNTIWMYDKRYKELDYLSCIYMPIPLQKDYDVVKGVDWPKLRFLEHEWKSFLKLMKIDENFERYFQHSSIRPHYKPNLTDKKRKNK